MLRGTGAAAITAALARPAGTAVPTAGVTSGFLVAHQLYHYEHHHSQHDSADYQAAPVILQKFQHIERLPKDIGRSGSPDRP